jgi:hypothetical protein
MQWNVEMKSVYYINFFPYNQCNKKAAVFGNKTNLKRERANIYNTTATILTLK